MSTIMSSKVNGLQTRYTDPLIPSLICKKDVFFPNAKEVSYQNHIVGFCHKPVQDGNYHGLNFILSNGKKSDFKPFKGDYNGWSEVYLP
jgi:hypothetical protein